MSDKVTVKNVIGSSRNPISQEKTHWIGFWKEHSTVNLPEKCPCCGEKSPLVGGHVTIPNESKKQYILPMCQACNNKQGEIFNDIERDLLVPVTDS